MKFHKSFFFWSLIVLLLFGSLVRFYNLGNIVLNRDEPLHTIRVCYQPTSFVVSHNAGSAFFGLLVHFLLPLGKIEIMARLPAAVFGILSILMIYFLGKLLFSKREGLLAAVFVSFAPYFIYYSRFSRAYTAYAFFAMLSMFFFVKALHVNKCHLWTLFIASTSLLIYTHYFSLVILPAYAVFVILMFLWEWRMEKKFPRCIRLSKIYLPFFLSIVAIFLILVFLYYPDQGARNMVQSYLFDNDFSSDAASFNPLTIFKNIFSYILYFKSLFFFWSLSGLALLGLISGFFDKRKSAFLIILSIFIPYLLFVFSGPRWRDVNSSPRYFIFFLPLFFICLAKGINKIASLASENQWFKNQFLSKRNLLRILLISGLSIMVICGFDFKHYYLNIVRLQSFKVEKKVHNFFKREIKRDSYVFFNTSPARYHNIIASPLTKKISPEEIPYIFRPKIQNLKESNDFMFYSLGDGLMDRMISYDSEVWAVIKASPDRIESLIHSTKKFTEAEASVLGDQVLIRLREGSGAISKKMQIILSILMMSKPPPEERIFLNLASARFSILEEKVSRARRALKKAQKGPHSDEDQAIFYTPFLFKILDKGIFESQDEIEKMYRDFYMNNLASLFFQKGNDLYGKKNFIKAEHAYQTAVELEEDLAIPVAKRFEDMGHFFLTQGKGKKAVKAYKEAFKLDSSLLFLNFSLAESYIKSGQMMEAKKALCQGLGTDILPGVISRWLGSEEPFVIIWKKESRWNLIVHSKKRTSYSGRITDIEDLNDLQSFQFRKKDTLSAENGEINFVLERSKRKFSGFQFRSKVKQLDIKFHINGEPAQDKIIYLDIEGSVIQLKN